MGDGDCRVSPLPRSVGSGLGLGAGFDGLGDGEVEGSWLGRDGDGLGDGVAEGSVVGSDGVGVGVEVVGSGAGTLGVGFGRGPGLGLVGGCAGWPAMGLSTGFLPGLRTSSPAGRSFGRVSAAAW